MIMSSLTIVISTTMSNTPRRSRAAGYIRYNPMKAELCKEPEEYPFLFVDEEAIGKMLAGV